MTYKKFGWPFSLYFLIFAGIAAYRPFLVLYYQSLSFTGAQIGLLVGIAPLITMVSLPLITGLADRTNRHKLIMSAMLVILVTVLTVYPSLVTFIPLLIMAVLSTVFFSPIMALSDSAAMFMLGERKDLYGRIRLGGTLGFSAAATLAGVLVQHYGLKIAFWSASGIFFIAFLVSQKLAHGEEEFDKSVKKGRASELLKNPHFLLFLLVAFSGGISFAMLNTYFFPYMKTLGAGESIMGVALTVGTISEIPILFFANRFIRRFKPYPIVLFSLAMTGVRFLLLAAAPNSLVVLVVQLLNGCNFPLLTVAGVTYADLNAPKGFRATAQGLFNASLHGIGYAVGGFAGGILFEQLGAKGMYLALGIFIAVVLTLVSLIRRMLPPEVPASV